MVYAISGLGFNDFCVNGLGAFTIGIAALAMNRWILTGASNDVVIISAIMPLLPGVIFTTAVRDTLNGGLFLGGSQDAGGSGNCSRSGGRSGCGHGTVPSADRRRRNMVAAIQVAGSFMAVSSASGW